MKNKKEIKYQYLSKWRNEWIDFNDIDGVETQLHDYKKYKYQIRIKPSDGVVFIT